MICMCRKVTVSYIFIKKIKICNRKCLLYGPMLYKIEIKMTLSVMYKGVEI
jgi:hypothetical protein